MATPPKRPIKPTKKVTPPEEVATTSTRVPDLTELREGVVALADRVSNLSTALSTVNEIQRLVIANERKAKENAVVTAQIQEDLIPRSEHEERWKEEQAELIRTRLSIRRQTYVVGTVFFLLSMFVLAIVVTLLVRNIHDQNKIRKEGNYARCVQSNEFRAQDKKLWNEVITLSSKGQVQTSAQKKTTQEFEKFLNKHDAPSNCKRVP